MLDAWIIEELRKKEEKKRKEEGKRPRLEITVDDEPTPKKEDSEEKQYEIKIDLANYFNDALYF